MASNIPQGVPQLNSPMVAQNGAVTQPWYLFFLNLWERTGGAQNEAETGFITGEIKPYGGPTIPTGFLSCDGSAISRTTFSNLFAAIGTTWGTGDGSSTFNLPALIDKTLLGAGNLYTLGETGGTNTVALTVPNLASHTHVLLDPGHTHTITDPGHTHTITDPGHHHTSLVSSSTGTTGTNAGTAVSGNTGTATTAITINIANTGVTNAVHTTGVTLDTTGSGSPFSIIPPYGAVNWIIKT